MGIDVILGGLLVLAVLNVVNTSFIALVLFNQQGTLRTLAETTEKLRNWLVYVYKSARD